MSRIDINKPKLVETAAMATFDVEVPAIAIGVPEDSSRFGVQGPQGSSGLLGPQGPTGSGLKIDGHATEIRHLPLSTSPNSIWMVGEDLYIFVGYNCGEECTPNWAWRNIGPISKPGPQGIQGIPGPKGDPFRIAYRYKSIEIMTSDFNNPEVNVGDFVIINTGEKSNEDNGKVYLKGELEWEFVVDLNARDIVGVDGKDGAQGPQGTAGEIGPQGFAGQNGVQGLQGVAGPQGAIGAQGIQGLQGIQGTKGETGTGIQGIMGPQGSTGSQGTQGPMGIGDPGTQGSMGVQGPQGPTGSGVGSVTGLNLTADIDSFKDTVDWTKLAMGEDGILFRLGESSNKSDSSTTKKVLPIFGQNLSSIKIPKDQFTNPYSIKGLYNYPPLVRVFMSGSEIELTNKYDESSKTVTLEFNQENITSDIVLYIYQ